MVARVVGAGAAVTVAVEACHGFLGEEGEGFFEDCGVVSGGRVDWGEWRGDEGGAREMDRERR